MMTEAEAATKRCPMSFAAAPGVSFGGLPHAVAGPIPGFNYGADSICHTAPFNCIGSACMAWREGVAAYPGNVHKVGADGKKYYLAGTERPAKGCCGMAGKL